MTILPALSTTTTDDPATTASTSNDDTTSQAAIDTTPISPSTAAQPLAHHLAHRPDAQDLRNRHILLHDPASGTSPALQQAAHELERQRAADALKRGLERRPEPAELVQRNILPGAAAAAVVGKGGAGVAPALLERQRELQLHMRKDSLDRQLQSRPAAEDLVQRGILNEDEVPQA